MTGAEAGAILDWFNGLDEVRQDVLLSVMTDVPVETLVHYGLLIRAIQEHRWSDAAFELANTWGRTVSTDRKRELTWALEKGRWDETTH